MKLVLWLDSAEGFPSHLLGGVELLTYPSSTFASARALAEFVAENEIRGVARFGTVFHATVDPFARDIGRWTRALRGDRLTPWVKYIYYGSDVLTRGCPTRFQVVGKIPTQKGYDYEQK